MRWETTYRDATGARPAITAEQDQVFEAMVKRHAEVTVAQLPPRSRCGGTATDHKDLYPLRTTPEGPI